MTADFDDCYRSNLQAIIVNWKNGVPGLPSAGKFEPVEIKRLKIEQNQLKVEMKNVSIHGLGDTKLTKLTHNNNDLSFVVKASVPKMRGTAKYKTEGRILFLPLNGNGDMWIEADNADFVLNFKIKLRDHDGFTFAEIQSIKTKIKNIGGFRIHFDNLFNGNKELESNTNTLFNENWRDFIDILKPTLEDTIDAVILARFKKIFDYAPANYSIIDVPSEKELAERNTVA
ncbi:circadian clock-controlled protein daywake-like [Teleopsis dalmanni]|nr:circadian clock-controlled protein daywake-like [Teleopsis dalmanni]